MNLTLSRISSSDTLAEMREILVLSAGFSKMALATCPVPHSLSASSPFCHSHIPFSSSSGNNENSVGVVVHGASASCVSKVWAREERAALAELLTSTPATAVYFTPTFHGTLLTKVCWIHLVHRRDPSASANHPECSHHVGHVLETTL